MLKTTDEDALTSRQDVLLKAFVDLMKTPEDC